MRRLSLAVATGLLVGGSSFALPGFEVDVSVGAVSQKPSGVIQYPVPTGDVIDVKKDLKIGDETKAFGRVKFEHPIFLLPNIYLQYMPMEFSGKGNITKSITYGGKTFQANTDIDSNVKLDRFDIGLYGHLPFIKTATTGVIDPEVGINVRVIDFSGRITGTSGGQVETASKFATIPIPMIYAGLGVNAPVIPVSFSGEIRGISYSKAKYYDWTVEAKVKPIKPLYISAGYRYEKLKIEDISDIYANLTIKGPFFMVGASF